MILKAKQGNNTPETRTAEQARIDYLKILFRSRNMEQANREYIAKHGAGSLTIEPNKVTVNY